MKTSYTKLLLILLTFSTNVLFSQSFFQKQEKPLKIISWNIYMLPGIANLSKEIKKSTKVERANQIVEIMNSSDYDIIVFQEAFYIPARKVLAKQLKEKYPFQYGPINKSFIKTNSGIFIVSKIELKELATTQFTDCEGTDCFAKKGAGIFEGTYNGKPFQIIGTHLDSKSQEVRNKQYIQIFEKLIKPNTKFKIPLIICGDMNTRISNKIDYKKMLSSFRCKDIKTTSKQVNTTVNNNVVIDYILLKNNKSKAKILDKSITTFNTKTKMTEVLKNTLSDHLAVEITIQL